MLGLDPTTLLAFVIVLLTAFSVHEFAHAWTADLFGDDTPRLNGRLTLNPLAHLDLMGSLMLLLAGFGWAKPVPVNLYALERRSSAAPMWVALAGPMSNFIMAILAAIPFWLGLVYRGVAATTSGGIGYRYLSHILSPFLVQILLIFLVTNLGLMLFNLIPIFPLDGEKIAQYAFPPFLARILDQIRPYGPMTLFAIIFLGRMAGIDVLGFILNPPMNSLLKILLPG
jgi:Zn-dependent protease